ncbi:hypothetical protein E2562_035349 [Oryza meyeriana var. granulata]|uniref:Uncharacterized protein n=1 Tax=Oryza meyeriana var. granulata TaxID=110450 RepID=A0A6G1CWL7_9ORYZ|nr:hypothetical protein E2562_035349 [Oryza meyeriana var. granulata]
MPSVQLSGAKVAAVTFTKKGASSFDGLCLAPPISEPHRQGCHIPHPKVINFVVTWQYILLKPMGDRVLVKLGSAEEKTVGGILLPWTEQSKPQGGEVVAVGEGKNHWG